MNFKCVVKQNQANQTIDDVLRENVLGKCSMESDRMFKKIYDAILFERNRNCRFKNIHKVK